MTTRRQFLKTSALIPAVPLLASLPLPAIADAPSIPFEPRVVAVVQAHSKIEYGDMVTIIPNSWIVRKANASEKILGIAISDSKNNLVHVCTQGIVGDILIDNDRIINLRTREKIT